MRKAMDSRRPIASQPSQRAKFEYSQSFATLATRPEQLLCPLWRCASVQSLLEAPAKQNTDAVTQSSFLRLESRSAFQQACHASNERPKPTAG